MPTSYLYPYKKITVKILITGKNGQVGKELVTVSGSDPDLDITALDRTALDITNRQAVLDTIFHLGPDAVINAAAYTAVDQAESEPELAFSINRDGPAHLAEACASLKIPLVHISTDYVFDGSQKGKPYIEDQPVGPLGVYGRSKAEGEKRVRHICSHHLIVRTSWVFSVHGSNFVKTIVRLARKREEMRVVCDQFGCPTSAKQIAIAIISMIKEFSGHKAGTYHFAQPPACSWHELAEAVVELAARQIPLKVKKIVPIPSSEYPTPARRPSWSVLDCTKIQNIFGISPPEWQVSLEEVIQQIVQEQIS